MSIQRLQNFLDQAGIEHFEAASLPSRKVRGGRKVDLPPENYWSRIIPTLRAADEIRNRLGVPVVIQSAYRTPNYNTHILKNESGNKSEHVQFRALDLSCSDHDRLLQVATEVMNELQNVGERTGLGYYDNFVHIDVGSTRRPKWRGDNRSDASEVRLGGPSRVVRDDQAVDNDTVYGKETSVRRMTPFESSSYVTPEELRKGIIAQIYYINEWHIVQLAQPEKEQTREEKDSGGQSTTIGDQPAPSFNSEKKGTVKKANLVSERKRYVHSLVEAEFYRRRFAARSVPAATGPFNPYPVSGFPGLIMNPGRPIIGQITNITHQINIESGSGTTAVTFSSPRYWDEGEVWYWFGGERSGDWLMRNFPQWHNKLCVATNNATPTTFSRTHRSDLDKYYEFMVGCDGIEYVSNHHDRASPEKMKNAVKNRDPGDLDVNPETLALKEYNLAIADTDDQGRFAPGTLAHKFFGPVKPYEVNEASATVESQIDYVERYGVRERELLVDFLGNRYAKSSSNGRIVLIGPTFGGNEVSAMQNEILDYVDDLSKRRLHGGV